MMKVRCYLAPSNIEGLGVYTAVSITKGEEVWRYDPDFDLSYPIDRIAAAPEHIREFMERYTYVNPFDPTKVILDADEARFMNHADAPNVDFSDDVCGRAVRDIAADEELTCDYACFTSGELVFQPPRHRLTPGPSSDTALPVMAARSPGRMRRANGAATVNRG